MVTFMEDIILIKRLACVKHIAMIFNQRLESVLNQRCMDLKTV